MTAAQRYGPWALVAGGSEGVGLELAMLLAERGLGLVLVARNADRLEHAADRVRASGVRVRTLSLDLSEPSAATQVLDATRDLEVGLLVWNAGANSHGGPFTEGDLPALDRVVAVNVTTMLTITHHLAAAMRVRRRGGVLLVGSLAGYVGTSTEAVYAGAKAFSRVFAEGLWAELAPQGVDVLELVLGVTRTPAMERAGLDLDLPGLTVSDPVDVAREALARLPHGPVHVVEAHQPLLASRLDPDRARVVSGTDRFLRSLVPPGR